MRLDLKSFVGGIIFACLVAGVAGAGRVVIDGDVGKYDVELSENRVVVIDTQTGRLWHRLLDPSYAGNSEEEISGPKNIRETRD